MASIKQAVILAGGKGERLRPLTENIPKPMAPVLGRPFLHHLVELLKHNGVTEIVFLLGYLHNKVTDYFGDGSQFGMNIKYSIGTVEDETGTRVRNAAPLLADKFLLMYGDNYWPMKLSKMESFYKSQGVLATTTIYKNRDGGGEYGFENNVAVDKNGRVLLYDKTHQDQRLNGVDIGFFLIDKKVLDLMPIHNFSFEKEIMPALASQNQLAGYKTDHPYYPITNLELLKKAEEFLSPKKVVFLDRDGVINKQMPPHDYVKTWKEFEFLPEAVPALQLLKDNGYNLFIVTNQRGIARGLMSKADLKNIHERMENELEKSGVKLSGIYHCPHDNHENCECRKPKPGMLLEAARKYYLDLTKTYFIGDSESDRAAGEAVGCKTIILKPNQSLLEVAKSIINS